MKKNILQNVLFCMAALAFLLIFWQIACVTTKNEYLIPSVWNCIQTAFSLLGEGVFWTAFFATLLRCFLAFVISFVLAVIFALAAYLLPWFSKFFAPIVASIRSLPAMAVILILLVMAGGGNTPVIVAYLTLFPMLYTCVYSALCDTDESLIQMSKIYCVPLKKQIAALYIPSALPNVTLGASAALSHSLKVVVSAEILSHTYQSLGRWMEESSLYDGRPELFALVLMICLTGLVIETAGNIVATALQGRVR